MNKHNATVVSINFPERRAIRCPKCHVDMSFTTLAGIHVEKCPLCHGTFFDKGEVESLIRRNIRFERFKVFRFFRWT